MESGDLRQKIVSTTNLLLDAVDRLEGRHSQGASTPSAPSGSGASRPPSSPRACLSFTSASVSRAGTSDGRVQSELSDLFHCNPASSFPRSGKRSASRAFSGPKTKKRS